jgi:WhiB family redox-sensing transcriptional regulator
VTGRPGAAGPKPLRAGLDLPVLDGAACKGQDPAPWFPRTGESPEAGKALCRTCPAQARCLGWALAKGEQLGTWGGTTPEERAEILRQRRHGASRGAVA